MKALPPPKYPPVPLTPVGSERPSDQVKGLLRKVVTTILDSDEVYSVTYSPVLCPESKNYLFTLKPYYWVIDGKIGGVTRWDGGVKQLTAVRRDGHRNPGKSSPTEPSHLTTDSDLPQGQKQLELLCNSIRYLALAVRYLPELRERANKRAERLVGVFFGDPETRMVPEVWFSQCVPGEDPPKGDGCFVIACRYLILVSQHLPTLALSPQTTQQVKDWLQAQIKWMATSEQGAKAREYGNNISIWYHALLYSHLSVINPSEALDQTQGYLDSLMARHATPSSFFQKELERTRPRHYTLFTLEPMFILVGLTLHPNVGSQLDSEWSRKVIAYLRDLIDFAKTVKPGKIEIEIDNDARYLAKMSWFDKMLSRFAGEKVDLELDGSPWEGGWNMAGRVSWGLL